MAGAFWYELAGFAHKPMTDFVATARFRRYSRFACDYPQTTPGRPGWRRQERQPRPTSTGTSTRGRTCNPRPGRALLPTFFTKRVPPAPNVRLSDVRSCCNR